MNKKNSMRKSFIKNVITTAISSFLFTVMLANAEEHAGEHAHDHGDNPVLTKIMFNQLELRKSDENNSLIIEAQAWVGNDLNKFWLKTDVEKFDGEMQEAEVQALYSRAIAPYWDMQIGLRQDVKPTPTRTWGVLGVQGLAPYFFEVDAALFVGDSGRTALRFSAEYELLFTQRLILSPEVAINLSGQNDVETGTGSGLSDINAGLRLRYEILRELAPYIGINWNKKLGETAKFAKSEGETISESEWVIGLRLWF